MRRTPPAFRAIALTFAAATVVRATVISIPTATVTSLGHVLTSSSSDMASSANGTPPSLGSYVQPGLNATLTGHDTLTWKITAPAGQKFVLDLGPNLSVVRIDAIADWVDPGAGGILTGPSPISTSASFLTPAGTVVSASPFPSGSNMGAGGKSFRISERIDLSFPFTNHFEFTELTLSNTYNFSIVSPSASALSPAFFTFRARATTATGDHIVMSLQPLPEPTTLLPTLSAAATLALARRARQARALGVHKGTSLIFENPTGSGILN